MLKLLNDQITFWKLGNSSAGWRIDWKLGIGNWEFEIMDTKLRNIIVVIIVALAVVGGIFYFLWTQENAPSPLNTFAKCLGDKGLKFYGAFWCPHCQEQKALFGTAKQYLPYIECSTPDSNGQLQVCTDAGIKGYPTWHFPDGTTQEGSLSPQELANKSGCGLPK